MTTSSHREFAAFWAGMARERTRWGRRLRRLPGNMSAALRLCFARHRQRQALFDIIEDRHLMRDIGVSRDEALREASKPFWKR